MLICLLASQFHQMLRTFKLVNLILDSSVLFSDLFNLFHNGWDRDTQLRQFILFIDVRI